MTSVSIPTSEAGEPRTAMTAIHRDRTMPTMIGPAAVPLITAGKFALGFGQAAFVAGAGVCGVWAALPDFAGIAGGIVSVGLAGIAVYGYFQGKRIETWKAMERAKIEIEVERARDLAPLITERFRDLSAQHAALIKQIAENTQLTRANHQGIVEVKQAITGSGDGIKAATTGAKPQ